MDYNKKIIWRCLEVECRKMRGRRVQLFVQGTYLFKQCKENIIQRLSIALQIYIIMKQLIRVVLICLFAANAFSLIASGDIQLFPNTETSPSIYLLPFTLSKAVPSNSYILVTMDWYSASLSPYNCILVNTTIAVSCTNLASPTFSLTITTAQILKFNSKLPTTKTIAILIGSNLLPNTEYALQVHLYNVIPNIKKISPSIEMYTISYNGLIYEANSNFGAVVNNPQTTSLMGVSILNSLSANSPGSISTLRAEVTIGKDVSTSLSTLLFVMQYPFTFSIGSIPAVTQSSLYATNPIALYSAPPIYSYEVITPNVFRLIFNEQFIVGRKFIVQINQINNPYLIASTNISIYSLNFNTLTPLEAFEMLYPIATVSYPLSLTFGLPYGAPFEGPMRFYQYLNQYVQLTITIPYNVPSGYSIRLQLLNAQILPGSAYANFQSLNYTTTYTYNTYFLIMSSMGPITVGTVITLNFEIYIVTTTLFQVNTYIDTTSMVTTFSSSTGSKYLYYGLVEGSGTAYNSFYWNIYDSRLGQGQRIMVSATIPTSTQWIYFQTFQNINPLATSAGSYIDVYFSPKVIISSTFNQNTDCQINQNNTLPTYSTNTCSVTITQTATYLRLTIRANSNYLALVPNLFPYQSFTYIAIKNVAFTLTSTNKNIFPVYYALYQSDVVNPITYYYATVVSVIPLYNTISGATFQYLSNMYSTTGATNFQTYPGVLRFQSTLSTALSSVIVQPNTQFTLVFQAMYGFRSFPSITNMQPYPCASNIPVQCTYYLGTSGGYNQNFMYDKIAVTFLDTSYKNTAFHIIIPDMQINQRNNTVNYFAGFYNLLTKDWQYTYGSYYYRFWLYWTPTPNGAVSNMAMDILGKAGSYRSNVSVIVENLGGITLGGKSFVFLSTQWSFYEMGMSSLSASTLGMASPATFGSNNMSPLSVYMTGGMYITLIPLIYTAYTSPFTLYLDKVHMPYSYDLPNYYIYTTESVTQYMVTCNSFLMTNGGTLYQSPLQSLTISCQDNAIGTVSTYCTIQFGTSNPMLTAGNIRVSLSGLTVATNICYLTASNGTSIPVTCSSSSDNQNVTVALQGSSIGYFPAGNFTLVIYGVGISNNSLSQSMTLYLYDSAIQYVIQSGVRILMTTIASLSYISLTQILYTYLNPLSYNTMTIQYTLPRMLYQDEQFAFVIGQDLSDVNTQPARLSVVITRQDGTVINPLFSIDNVNYLIVFSFTDPTLITTGNYVMTIYGICTPASQANGAFNMIYRRIYDYTYTIVNSANVIFPSFNSLTTSNISIATYFNTQGYKQQIDFSIVNSQLNVDENNVWIVNFPSYYSPQVFQQDAYCMIDSAVIPCSVDPNTPYQLVVSSSPKIKNVGVPYVLSIVGVACPRNLYTNNAFLSRYIFIGVLQNSSSTYYSERALLLPYQSVQSMVGGVLNVVDMIGVSSNLYSFSSIYAQFELYSSVAITSGSYLYIDLPIEFNNLNNLALNVIIVYGANVISSSTVVVNRRIQIPITLNIALKTLFLVEFPNLPTPKSPCTVVMSDIIVTVTPSNKLSVYSASSVQGNSAPVLTFVQNTKYISFNNDQTIVITAGTYSAPISIASSDNHAFLSNININLTSTGFYFVPSSIFLPIGVYKETFTVGADGDLVPVVYFYSAIKQEEVNTNYQITLNMNIEVTNNPVQITLLTTLVMPKGGCTNPFLILLSNPPFADMTITYSFDNNVYSQNDFYPNPLTTLSQMSFNSSVANGTFSFCSSSDLAATQIPITFYLTGTNYESYEFVPSNVILVSISTSIANVTPSIGLILINQQKTFLDVNFTSNVDGTFFYQMMLGQNMTPLDAQSIQIFIKANKWVLAAQSSFMTHIYTSDIDNRLGKFFQIASTSTVRVSSLLPQTYYTLCAYLINNFGVTSTAKCIQLSTMTWGTVIKASLQFSHSLNAQQLNNILCFFTVSVGTSQLYLVDQEGNQCGNRVVSNNYYQYTGSSFITEARGTNIYLVTNPYLTGTDPSPLAFTNLFNSQGQLSSSTLSAAQSLFSITYLSGAYVNSYNARLMTSPSQASNLAAYFTTPIYNSHTSVLTVSNVQIVGSIGTVYFILVLYKQISNDGNGTTSVNIRMNYAPSAEQVLNCQNWQGDTANGCVRAVYTGVSALTVTFSGVQTNSLYMLYYLPATEFPLRPIVTGQVQAQTIVTYSFESTATLFFLTLSLIFLVMM